MPDMKAVAEQARKLDDLLERGDEAGLSKALAELGENLKSLRQALDQNLEGFGAERFPQENRVVAELMKKIGDLEGDERALQKETQGLADRQEAEMEKRLKGQLDEFLKRENEKVERLRSRLAGVPTGDPESALAEEIERARDSAKQMKRLFAERDLAEAKGEAERAASSLDRAVGAPGRRRGGQPQAAAAAGAARRRRGGERGARDRAGDRRRSREDPAARQRDDVARGSRAGAPAGRAAERDWQPHRRGGGGGGEAAGQDAGAREGRVGSEGRGHAHAPGRRRC